MKANNLLSKEKNKKSDTETVKLVQTFREKNDYDQSLHSQEKNKCRSITLNL